MNGQDGGTEGREGQRERGSVRRSDGATEGLRHGEAEAQRDGGTRTEGREGLRN